MRHRAAHRSRPCSGEIANGDRAIVRALPDGVLLSVIDGLGHGPDAERAALLALAVLEREDRDPAALVELAHRALRGTRGAAIMVAVARAQSIEAVGVGNVALRSTGGLSFEPRPAPGIVGANVPRQLRATVAPLRGRARVVIFSDGIARRFEWHELDDLAPDAACDHILAQHAIAHDDATVLVADLDPS